MLQVREAFTKKVSRERVGAELDGMFLGPDPVRAMVDLNRLCLFPAVFTVTPDTEKKLPSNWGQPCVHLVTAAADTLRGVKFQADISKEDHKLALVAALLLPLRAVKTADKKGKATSVVPFIIGDSIKWKKAHATDVAELQRQAPQLLQAYQSLQGLGGSWRESAPDELRTKLGLAVRQLKDHWRIGVVTASLLSMPAAKLLGVDSAEAEAEASESETSSGSVADTNTASQDATAARVACCHSLESAVLAFNLDKCWKEAGWKPLLDGKQIKQASGAVGPQIGKITEQLVQWQLAHPDATQEAAEKWLSSLR